jgi:hypothetical protein
MPKNQWGVLNPRWKGGTYISKESGYRFIKCPEHPNSDRRGYIREHVLVMSTHLGRPLVKNECVHHKNEDKLDNRIENLELITRAEHASHHHKGLRKPESLKNLRRMTSRNAYRIWATTRAHERREPKPCERCQRPFFYTFSKKQRFCSRGCLYAARAGL